MSCESFYNIFFKIRVVGDDNSSDGFCGIVDPYLNRLRKLYCPNCGYFAGDLPIKSIIKTTCEGCGHEWVEKIE